MFGFIFSLLIGALAGYIAGRIMGSETSTVRNIVLGILGGFVQTHRDRRPCAGAAQDPVTNSSLTNLHCELKEPVQKKA